jgi:hypothetical protein
MNRACTWPSKAATEQGLSVEAILDVARELVPLSLDANGETFRVDFQLTM